MTVYWYIAPTLSASLTLNLQLDKCHDQEDTGGAQKEQHHQWTLPAEEEEHSPEHEVGRHLQQSPQEHVQVRIRAREEMEK